MIRDSLVAGEAEEACIDAVNALPTQQSAQIWTSDSDVFCRLILQGNIDIEVVRYSGFRFYCQTPRQVLIGIGFTACDQEGHQNYLQIGLALFFAWISISQHDMKPSLCGVGNYKTFLSALAKEIIKDPLSIDEVRL